MAKLRYILNLFLISVMTLIALSCSTDNTLTGNSDRIIEKPIELTDINSDDSEPWWWYAMNQGGLLGAYYTCIVLTSLFAPYFTGELPDELPSSSQEIIGNRDIITSMSYDFRDNFLAPSKKGRDYIKYYEEVSRYSNRNNLIGKYYIEHLNIIKTCVDLAYSLQHDSVNNQILINPDSYNELKNMINIYRESANHREIDYILNVIEKDLDNYYYQSKSVIAKDFK